MRNRHSKDTETFSFQRGIPVEQFKGFIDADKLLSIRTIPVAWGIPYDEIMFSKFMIYFEKNAFKMPWDDFIPSEGTYVRQARNYIHNTFKNKSTLPYLMMLDSDILFPPHIVEALLALKKPIVGGWYKDKKSPSHHPVVYDFDREENNTAIWKHRNSKGNGLEKVDATGAGCWLMSREVAEALGDDPYGRDIAGGEDMILCRKLMKLGIPLHVDWSLELAHMGVGVY